jgi:MFS family permease
VFVAGQALLPPMPDELDRAFGHMLEHRDRLTAAHLLTACGAFLFLPALGALAGWVPRGRRGRGALVVGIALVAVGTFANALSQVVQGYTVRAATAPDVPVGAGPAVLRHVGEGLVGLPISFLSIPVFTVGLLMTGVALAMSRALPAWVPVLLVVGTVMAAATAGRGPVVALTMAPLALGFALAGSLRARPTSDVGEPVAASAAAP